MGGVVHPSPPLDRLVSRGVDEHHAQVREEQKPYPNVVVCLSDAGVGVGEKQIGYKDYATAWQLTQ